jgi:hypothetical protein
MTLREIYQKAFQDAPQMVRSEVVEHVQRILMDNRYYEEESAIDLIHAIQLEDLRQVYSLWQEVRDVKILERYLAEAKAKGG